MANRRRTYEDLRQWLVAENEAFEEERRGRVLGQRGPDGDTVYNMLPKGLFSNGVANADLVADRAGRDRKTILAYRKADWPKSAWLPYMQRHFLPFDDGVNLSDEELEREFLHITRRYRDAGRHRSLGEWTIDQLARGQFAIPDVDPTAMTDEDLAELLGVSPRTIRRRKVRGLL